MLYQNVYSLFRSQCAKYGEKPVFYTKSGSGWSVQTWAEFEERTLALACAFLAKGLKRGASVAILAGNVPEWTIADIAAIAAGGVGVGIYPTSSPEQCAYIIEHSDAEFVITDSRAQLAKVASSKFENVREILCIEDGSFERFLDLGREHRSEYLPQVEAIGGSLHAEDIAIMVYTSGTTGQPKGAMLSHRYVLNSVESLRLSVPIFDTDVSFSYLPGCHVAERISGIYNRLYNGTSVHFVDDLSRLYEYMLDVRPTVFASLPRFFEKMHSAIVLKHAEGTIERQAVKDGFGGRIRLLTSGGAPLPTEIAQFFANAGVPILQAYGLTENICAAFNTFEHLKFGTVGRPMPMCEIKIAADGEILISGRLMFSGYYKEPEKTAEMFTDDGWLLTGDLGELDEDGFLRITGRKKEMIVLSSGKNVAPALIENMIRESHLISQCFVYGDGRSYCVALVTLNPAEAAFAGTYAEMAKSEVMRAAVEKIIAAANTRVSNSEQVKRFAILERDLDAEHDEVTPTMKLKRKVVAGNFKELLEKLYES